ncbi:hypothetical protein AK51_03310 [Serratia nematodiphila DZ0503SBS1]|nr:hypothetical protein AK51_03310 [Serratia nematodiphila DZ0503SBS1]
MLLLHPGGPLLPGEGVELRRLPAPLRRLADDAMAVGDAQLIHHQVERPFIQHHMVEQQRQQLLAVVRIAQQRDAQRQLGGQIEPVLAGIGQQGGGVARRRLVGEAEPRVVREFSSRHHHLHHLALLLDKA